MALQGSPARTDLSQVAQRAHNMKGLRSHYSIWNYQGRAFEVFPEDGMETVETENGETCVTAHRLFSTQKVYSPGSTSSIRILHIFPLRDSMRPPNANIIDKERTTPECCNMGQASWAISSSER